MENGLCRLTVCGPKRRVDLAVPVDVVTADLLPVLLNHLGADLADTGLGHGGWVLQRLGGAPLDENDTLASAGFHDGETVHLRPRADQLPPADFDDLIDGVAAGTRERAGRWRPAMTRWAAVTLLAVVLALGLVVLALPDRPPVRAVTAGAIAVGCLAAAYGLRQPGAVTVVLTLGGAGYAALAGLILPTPPNGTGGLVWSTPHLLTGAVAAAALMAVGFAVLRPVRPLCAAVLTAAALTGVSAGAGLLTGLTVPRVAGVVVVVATVAVTVVPVLAFRFSGLRLSPLPTTPEHLQEELDPVPSADVLQRAAVADRYMTALYGGIAAPTAVALVVVAHADGWSGPTLAAVAALVLLLASRPMTSGWHRLALLGAAVAGVAGVAVHLAVADATVRLLLPAAAVPVGVLGSVLIARHLPGRRLMPYWGRVGDLLHVVAGIALLPVLLALLDVYDFARAIGG